MKTTETLEDLLKMFKPTAQEYAAVYARKSTKAENNSLESQTALALDVIKEKGLLLYKIYSDSETATKFEPIHRLGFKELMHDAMNERFKTLIVYRRDRLARKAEHLIEIKKFFKKHGIKVIYSNDGEFQPDDTYISNFIENVIMAVDELEPRILSERIDTGKRKKRERGEYSSGRNIPFGYERKVENGKTIYKQIPEEAELIKKVFEGYLDNQESDKMKAVIDEIKRLKAIKSNQTCDEKYLEQKRFSLANMIKAPVYGGLQFKDLEMKIDHENVFIIDNIGRTQIKEELLQGCTNAKGIVDKEIWYKAVNKWKVSNLKCNKGRKKEETQLFKNLLFCKSCKKKVWFEKSRFRCKNGCFNMSTDVAVHKLLYDILMKFLRDKRFLNVLESKVSEIDISIGEKELEISRVSEKIKKKTIDIIIKGNTIDESMSKIFSKEKMINKELTDLKIKRMNLFYIKDNIQSLIITPSIIDDNKERQEYLQNILQSLIEKVYIDENDAKTSIIFKE